MLPRPLGQRRARALRDLERLRTVAGQEHLVDDVGDVVAQAQKIVLAAGGRIPLVTRRRRLPIGSRPVDGARGQRGCVQPRLAASAHHHRKDDAIVDAGELSVADDAGPVGQEETEQHGLGRGRRRARRHSRGGQPAHRDNGESCNHQSPVRLFIVLVRQRMNSSSDRPCVEKLWMTGANPVENPPSQNYFQTDASTHPRSRNLDDSFALRFA